ncbi:hypothetical protein GPECTOR_24g168 [Gonium pectorale]|uniref:Uncharacterized protein n=1 Tax=Gonium pectorale TaxID=33097 RepID=A0A150GGB0_GONPE|nr:hypothetical protein GPECTOR_24g168 [Gonium pectorale]|eukprot:KXZ48879.1 hypothetical protein GPECTOR_24g168 [Gonium pectorale]
MGAEWGREEEASQGVGRLMIRGSLVLDATGHARRLVEYDKKFDPGFQGAYGIVAEVESHPFALDTMLFMDWRDDHTHAPGLEAMRAANEKLPTFLYAMPFTKNKVFLEETALVTRPALDFPELKERLQARLKYLGIKVTRVEEEEYCLIPMGGVLPKHPQRVLALGGTAGERLIVFGLSLFVKSNNAARASLLARGIPGLIAMLGGLLPTLGDYYGDAESLKERKDAVDAAARKAAKAALAAAAPAASAASSSSGAKEAALSGSGSGAGGRS